MISSYRCLTAEKDLILAHHYYQSITLLSQIFSVSYLMCLMCSAQRKLFVLDLFLDSDSFIVAYPIFLVNVQTDYCNNNLLVLDVKQLKKIIKIHYFYTLKALWDGHGKIKMYYRCIMGCQVLNSYQEEGLLHTSYICCKFLITVIAAACHYRRELSNLAPINLLKANNRNTRIMCVICSKLIIKTPERHQLT